MMETALILSVDCFQGCDFFSSSKTLKKNKKKQHFTAISAITRISRVHGEERCRLQKKGGIVNWVITLLFFCRDMFASHREGRKSEFFLFVDLTDSTLGRCGGTVTKEQFWYLVNWTTIFIQLWLPLCRWWWCNSFNHVILLNKQVFQTYSWFQQRSRWDSGAWNATRHWHKPNVTHMSLYLGWQRATSSNIWQLVYTICLIILYTANVVQTVKKSVKNTKSWFSSDDHDV